MHPFRSSAFLLLAAAFLSAFVFLFDRDFSADSRSDAARRAFRFDPSRVLSVSFSWPASETVVCERRAKLWRITAPVDARADSNRIDEFLEALAAIPADDLSLLARNDPDSAAAYGFSPPRLAIALNTGSATNTLLVGRSSPIGNGVFVRRTDHDGVLRIPESALARLPRNINDLRSSVLLSADPSSVCRIDVQQPGAAYLQIDRLSSSHPWRLQPNSRRADPAAISDFLSALLSASVTRFVSDDAPDLSAYALDPQSATVVSIATDNGNASQAIAFGNPLPDNSDLVFARLLSEHSVYAVPAAALHAIRRRPEELLDTRLAALSSPALFTHFRASSPSQSLELAYNADSAAWSILRPLRAPADPSAVSALFLALSSLRILSFDSTPPPDAPPILSLSVSLAAEPEPHRIDFFSSPDDPSSIDRILYVDPPVSTNPVSARLAPPGLPKIDLSPVLYASRSVLALAETNIVSISLSAPDRQLKLVADPLSGDWAKHPDLRSVLDDLSDLRAAEWLPGPNLPPDAPTATLTLSLSGLRASSYTFTIASNGVVAFRGHPNAFRLPQDSPLLLWAFPPPDPDRLPSAPANPTPF